MLCTIRLKGLKSLQTLDILCRFTTLWSKLQYFLEEFLIPEVLRNISISICKSVPGVPSSTYKYLAKAHLQLLIYFSHLGRFLFSCVQTLSSHCTNFGGRPLSILTLQKIGMMCLIA